MYALRECFVGANALPITVARNAPSATAYIDIPPNRVIELGAQIDFLRSRRARPRGLLAPGRFQRYCGARVGR